VLFLDLLISSSSLWPSLVGGVEAYRHFLVEKRREPKKEERKEESRLFSDSMKRELTCVCSPPKL
jgi:hypothetical protein